MLSITYLSTASRLYSDEEMVYLLAKCRSNNARLGITGLLLYRPHGFIQILEGPNETVLGMLNKIRHDPRHRNLTVVMQEAIEERDFFGCWMDYYRIGAHPEGFNDFLNETGMAVALPHPPRRVHRLMATCRDLFNQ